MDLQDHKYNTPLAIAAVFKDASTLDDARKKLFADKFRLWEITAVELAYEEDGLRGVWKVCKASDECTEFAEQYPQFTAVATSAPVQSARVP